MVSAIRQAQLKIAQINSLNENAQVKNMEYAVNYVLIPFEGNTNPGDPQGIKFYLNTTKEIEKEAENLDISV